MDLRDLRYFEVIAELEHMGRAASRLHRTQPALTSAVRRLEEDCGVALFERAGRGIRLTAAGHVMLKWARRARFDIDDAQRELKDLGRGLVGTIRIGIVPTAAQFMLPAAVRQLLAEAPDVDLQAVVALIDVLEPQLRAGHLEMTIGTERAKLPGFVSRFVSEDQIVVAASADHELFQGTPTLKDLTNYRWVLQPRGAPTRDWLDQTFERRRLPKPRVQVESTMLLSLPTLIAETGLLSFISSHNLEGSQLRAVEVKGTTMRRRIVVTHREGGYLSPASRRLIELLTQSALSDGS